jgi:protein-disulfide isomerase
MNGSRVRSIADLAVTIALGAAAVLVVWRTVAPSAPTGGPRPREPVENVRADRLSTSVSDTHVRGDPRAPVILIEFSDFECPFCEKYSKETFGLIDQKFVATGQLRFAFRHFPLEQMHPNALAAAEAAECASDQGKFWEMRGLLFTNQKDLSQRFWQKDIPSIGLDPTAFADCLNGVALSKVRDDIAEGQRLGVNSTPSFFVGAAQPDGSVSITSLIRGAQPLAVFENVLKESL